MTVKLDSMRALYLEQLRDLHSAETQLVEALPKAAKTAHNGDQAADRLRSTLTEARETKDALTQLAEGSINLEAAGASDAEQETPQPTPGGQAAGHRRSEPAAEPSAIGRVGGMAFREQGASGKGRPGATRPPGPGPPHGARPRRVVLADDHKDGADSLAELLRLKGHDVFVAYDGQQAVDLAGRCGPTSCCWTSGCQNSRAARRPRRIRRQSWGRGSSSSRSPAGGRPKWRSIAGIRLTIIS
jgi:hypothetical protein